MTEPDHKILERQIIIAATQLGKTAGAQGIIARELVQNMAKTSQVPAVDVRKAIWRLVDLDKMVFVQGRRLKVSETNEAA